MSNTMQSCPSAQVLEQLRRNDLSPDELFAIEEHVSECPRCREMFDSHYTASPWSEFIRPALSQTQLAATSVMEDGVEHSAAILKLLGPTDDPNMLGRIGNYEIVGLIGQGGMGAVFKGFDRSLNRFVAIKMLLPHLAASGAARKRFAREGQAVAAVVDDHVMAIHCVDQWQGIPYLVMTYSRGVSLQKRLNDSGPFEVREILRIGMQAAKGLAAAHAQGIVHRDIKPSNILLDQNVERVQLVDFGLARAVDDASLTCSGTLAGTPQYMSPEQARAEAVDHRSDLFSLGSVLYAMCAGHAPFRAESSYSVLRLIIEKEPRSIREINSDIPDWLTAIIRKLMAKHTVDRFDSARQVADLLEACLAHVQQPTAVPLPSTVVELVSPGRSSSGRDQFSTSNLKAKTRRRFVGPPTAKVVAAAAAAAAFLFAGVVIILELNKGTLTIKSVADDVPIRIVQGKDTVEELTISKQGTTTRLRAGTYTVEIAGDSTAYEIHGDNVTVKRGQDTLVDISINRPAVATTPPVRSTETAQPPGDISKASAAPTKVDVELLLSNLEFLNNREDRGTDASRSVRYGRILMELAKAGPSALPKIIETLDRTEDDRMIASLAFVLRAIGDKRGVPALIRAIPKTPWLSPCNWVDRSPATAGELDLFFRTHRFKGQGDAGLGCSNSWTELSMTLGALTNAEFPISQTYGSGTERQIYLQRQVLHNDAKRWADWWEANSSRLVEDSAYEKADLPPLTMPEPKAVDPTQLLDKLAWQFSESLSAVQAANAVIRGGYPLAFLDLDTGRSEALPPAYRDKQLSDAERTNLLAWAKKEGFDLFCDQMETKDPSPQYVLRGLGLKAWQIDDKLWTGSGFESASWSEMANNGREVTDDRLIPYSKKNDERDPAAMGLFLFVTREGTPGWIYVGAQVTEEQDPSGIVSADWLKDNKGFVKGRKLGLHFFESNELLRTERSALTKPSDVAPSQHIQLAKTDAKATIDSVLELSSILGIAQPQLLALAGAPQGIHIAPSDVNHAVIADWVRLVDLSNSKDPKATEDVAVKKELVALRHQVLNHLEAQAELRLTQLVLENLVSNEQGSSNEKGGKSNATELAPATMAALRQKATDQFNELRSAAQKTAFDTDLQEPLETGKSEIVVTPLPLKFVSSQKAQATILNTSRLFGVFPEEPASDARTNVLIIVKNGRQKYFTSLAETLDRSTREDAMSFDERIELWKNRLRLLAMLKRAVGADNSAGAKGSTPNSLVR